MPRINLLPWRAARRKERQRDFIISLGLSLMVASGIVFYAGYHVEGLISFQEKRNQFLDNEIKRLQADIVKVKDLQKKLENLRDRMDIIKRLQTSRPEIVHLFDELPRLLPEGIYLTALTQKERLVTLDGSAQSNARVSTLMRNINSSAWITNPNLNIIQTDKKEQQDHGRISKFSLQVQQKNPNDPNSDLIKPLPAAKGKKPDKTAKPAKKPEKPQKQEGAH